MVYYVFLLFLFPYSYTNMKTFVFLPLSISFYYSIMPFFRKDLLIHKILYFLSLIDLQLFQNIGNIMLYCINR